MWAALPSCPTERYRVAKVPFRVSPMLATLVDAPFTRENWIFEEKYDGVRMLAYKEGSRVSLISRNAINRTERYPHVAEFIHGLKADTLLLDGEIVVFDSKGVSRFQLLQRSEGHPQYAVFDCLYHNGQDLRRKVLSDRRSVLESLIPRNEDLLLSAVLSCDGFEAFKTVSKRGLEGVVAKNLNSFYESRRSREWLKVKVHQQQEFVIGGFTKPKGSREDFGALLLGVYDQSGLRFVGKVGTGFDEKSLRTLRRKFRPLTQPKSRFIGDDVVDRDVTFLKPNLVAQISFTEWTGDGKLRHPVFLGLRDDKDPKDVRREA
jgi:bifunctional non-homologous end joining protein LigD